MYSYRTWMLRTHGFVQDASDEKGNAAMLRDADSAGDPEKSF